MESLHYFALVLKKYLGEEFPQLTSEAAFITERSQSAAFAFCKAIHSGASYEQAMEEAYQVLYHRLLFSPFRFLCHILEKEFEDISNIPTYAVELLPVCKETFSRYWIEKDGTVEQENNLYTELVGTIAQYIEKNDI